MSPVGRIWCESSIIEYILIWVVIVVFLIFIIPRDDWIYAYLANVVSYGIVIAYIYYWSLRTNYENRDMRLVFLIFYFVMLLSIVFHYYTTNDVIAIVMLSITFILLVYLIVRGIKGFFFILLLIPIALVVYYITIEIIT